MNNINEEITKAYFNNIAKNYNVNDHKGNVDKSEAFIRELLPPEIGSPILECGGGGGFYTLPLLKMGYKIHTIDLSSEALQRNIMNAKSEDVENSLTTIEGNFNEVVPKLNIKFKQILFIKVLHHFDNLAEIQKAIELAYKALGKNGKIIIFEPNGRNPFLKFQKDKLSGKSKWTYEKNLQLTTVNNLSYYFKANDIKYKVLYKYVMPGLIIQRNNLLAKFLKSLNKMLEKTFFKHCAFNILITISK